MESLRPDSKPTGDKVLPHTKVLKKETVSHPSRRDGLRFAAGLGLSFALPGLDLFAANKRGNERPKSLITLWMQGGSSQLETWDPHPGTKVGGPTQAIATKQKGLEIAATYPQLAEQIHHLSVIRSLISKEGDHERGARYVKTGYRPDTTLEYPALGAILAHEMPDEDLEIPAHVALGGGPFPPRGGFLGAELDAFKIFNPGQNIRNMRSRVPDKRQDRRLKNLEVISRTMKPGRRIPTNRTLHQQVVEKALLMMRSEQLKAFDIEVEPEELKARYGDTRFGRGCLVARRLVEEGVRAVEVMLDGWDTHAENFSGHTEQAGILDPAFATLIDDLRSRDLLDSTIVLCIGEFGRTPRINPLEGRDHWPTGFSCVVGGGGLNSGVLLGETDPTGDKKAPARPVKVNDLIATILTACSLNPANETYTRIGRPIALSDGEIIPQLLPTS